MIENLPFMLHRFVADCLSSRGLILLEQPIFYIITLIALFHSASFTDYVGDAIIFVLDLSDNLSLLLFIFASLSGNFIQYIREWRVQREIIANQNIQ